MSLQRQDGNDDTMSNRLSGVNQRLNNEVIRPEPQNLTVEKLKSFMPKGASIEVTEAVLDKINNVGTDTGLMQEVFEEQVLSYAHLTAGKGRSLEKLINALKYCNLKLIEGMTNERAWAIVFPDKYDKLIRERRFVGSHVSMYNSSEMVVEIDKLLMVPVAIQYAPVFHSSIQKMVNLSNGIGAKPNDTVSAHVQLMAAVELAKLTKMPEIAKVEVDVKVNQGSIIDEYEKAINMMANAKMNELSNGGKNMYDVINAPVRAKKEISDADSIIEAEVE